MFKNLISEVSDADVAPRVYLHQTHLMRLVARLLLFLNPGWQVANAAFVRSLERKVDSCHSAPPIAPDKRRGVCAEPADALFLAPSSLGAIRNCHMPADKFLIGALQ